jgi:hypothetical protein
MSSFDVIDFLSKYQDPTITFTVQKPGKGEGNNTLSLLLQTNAVYLHCITAVYILIARCTTLYLGTLCICTDSQRVLELDRAFEKISNPVEYSLSEQSNGKKVGYIQIKEFNAVVTDKVREVSVLQSINHTLTVSVVKITLHFTSC